MTFSIIVGWLGSSGGHGGLYKVINQNTSYFFDYQNLPLE